MASGREPVSSSRATRSTSVLVLPEPALAATNTEAAGLEATTCEDLAGRMSARTVIELRSWSGRLVVAADHAPFPQPRQMVVVAAIAAHVLRRRPGDVRRGLVVEGGDAALQAGERPLGKVEALARPGAHLL